MLDRKQKLIYLIEIIFAVALLVAEIAVAIAYRFGWIMAFPIDVAVKTEEYLGLSMLRLFAILTIVDVWVAIAIILVNSKSKRYDRIFEIFVAALLLIVEIAVLAYQRSKIGYYGYPINDDRFFVRSMIVFTQIDLVYAAALLIIKSPHFRMWKAIVTVSLALIQFLTMLYKLGNVYGGALASYRVMITTLVAFSIMWILYVICLKLFDIVLFTLLRKISLCDRRKKEGQCE